MERQVSNEGSVWEGVTSSTGHRAKGGGLIGVWAGRAACGRFACVPASGVCACGGVDSSQVGALSGDARHEVDPRKDGTPRTGRACRETRSQEACGNGMSGRSNASTTACLKMRHSPSSSPSPSLSSFPVRRLRLSSCGLLRFPAVSRGRPVAGGGRYPFSPVCRSRRWRRWRPAARCRESFARLRSVLVRSAVRSPLVCRRYQLSTSTTTARLYTISEFSSPCLATTYDRITENNYCQSFSPTIRIWACGRGSAR